MAWGGGTILGEGLIDSGFLQNYLNDIEPAAVFGRVRPDPLNHFAMPNGSFLKFGAIFWGSPH